MFRFLIVNYGYLTNAQFAAFLKHLALCAKNNANFPEPWPAGVTSSADLETRADAFAAAVSDAEGGDHTKIMIRNGLRTDNNGVIVSNANYYEMIAKGNIQALESTGYRMRKIPVKVLIIDPPAAPVIVKVVRGPVSGTAILYARCADKVGCFELQSTTADATVDANWGNTMQLALCGRIALTGLTPLKTYQFRLRAFNKAGWGPWSNSGPITIL